MPQAIRRTTTEAVSNANADEKPSDTVLFKLTHAQGVLLAIANTYDDAERNFMLPAPHMNNALWAAETLVSEALEAFEAMPNA